MDALVCGGRHADGQLPRPIHHAHHTRHRVYRGGAGVVGGVLVVGAVTFHIDGHNIEMGPLMLAVFAALFNARGRPLTDIEIGDVVYKDHPNGGPDSDNIIRVTVQKLRARLLPTSFRLVNSYGRGYHLARLPEVIAVADL